MGSMRGSMMEPQPFPPAYPQFHPQAYPQAYPQADETRKTGAEQMAQVPPHGMPPWMRARPPFGVPDSGPSPRTPRKVPDDDSHASRNQPSVALREAWAAARRSFWEQDPATTEKAYQTLIREYPDEPDLPGELGNIYLNQGRWQEATDLYYEAGMRALRSTHHARVGEIMGILYSLDPAKAEALRQNMKTRPR